MTGKLHQRAGEVFVRVRGLRGVDRSRRLDELCAADTALRNEVESLLSHDGGSAPIDSPLPAAQLAQAFAPPAGNGDEPPPERIGKYRITGLLGEGGMGVVYRAEQDQPRRVVALKVMRGVARRAALLRRFEREAEALARLQHPGIAQVFEIGQAESQSGPIPYLAMELVEGPAITDYVRQAGLDASSRIALLAHVADAVHHAHTKGVIHRDLKPANILVKTGGEVSRSSGSEASGSGLSSLPKVLDFGVARLTDERPGATAVTDAGQLVGTIRYMSPEQLGGDAHAADVRSDVYALGLVGYEVLTGLLPYDLNGKALADVTRIIRETEPTPLSRHDRSLAGDPEVILAKALEKDPARRYASAAEFADDLRRFLTDQPITARPASASYQIRKFARRNRALVVAAGVGVVALLTVAVVSTVAAVTTARARDQAAAEAEKASKARDLAAAEAEAATKARDLAANEAERAMRALEFIRRILSAAHPDREGIDVRVVDVLDNAAKEIESSFAGQPRAEAYARHTIGAAYLALGRLLQAEEHLRKAGDLRAAAIGEDHPDTIVSRLAQADALKSARKTKEASDVVRGVLDRRIAAVGEDDDLVRNAVNVLAQIHILDNKLEDAEREGRRAVEIARRINAQGEAIAAPMVNLALALDRLSRFDESERMCREAIDILNKSNGPEHSLTSSARGNLAQVLRHQGHLEQAYAEMTTLLEIDRRLRGPEHSETVSSESNLANLCIEMERYEEAVKLLEHCRESSVRTMGAANGRTLSFINNLASAYIYVGRLPEAETMFRAVLEEQTRQSGPTNQSTLVTTNNLARAIHKQGRLEEAYGVFSALVASAKQTMPQGHPVPLAFQIGLGQVLADLKRFEEAEALLKESLEGLEAKVGPKHQYSVKTRDAMASMYEAWGKPDLAAKFKPAK